jgi:hypothetical protein
MKLISMRGGEMVVHDRLVLSIGNVTLDIPVILAPMAGYTDVAMRPACLHLGCGMVMTEVVSAEGVIRDSHRTLHILDTAPGERPIAAHLYGADPGALAAAAAICEEMGRFDSIDINCGCPVRKIVAKGAGAALMAKPERIEAIVCAVRAAVRLPVTVKTRIGLRPDRLNISEVAQAVEGAGAAAIARLRQVRRRRLQHQQRRADHGPVPGNMDSKAPFIIQISKGARSYTDKRMLEAMIRAADEIFPDAIFAVHLDHGDEKTCMDCIDSGFYSSVMIDASHETSTRTSPSPSASSRRAHAKGISVEAELGQLGGVEEHFRGRGRRQADRPEAGRGVRQAHRLRQPGLRHRHQPRRLQVQRRPGPALRRHRGDRQAPARLPAGDARLQLGPAGRGARINAAGGKLKGAKGVDEKQITKAARWA